MKKITALVVISMFALAACQPLNLSASGEVVDVAVDSLNGPLMETEDSNSDEPSDGESDSSDRESSDSSDAMGMESSSEISDSSYSVNIWLEDGAIIPEALTLHEGSVITWTNNDSVSYTISIMKMDDSSDDYMDDNMDDSMDDSSDDSYNDDSSDDSNYSNEFTVEPGQTISFTLPDSGTYQFTITGGLISLSGTITVSDSESEDSYDDEMDDSYDGSNDDYYDDNSDDSYDDSSDDSYDDSSDDSYDDSDEYDDGYDDEEDDSDKEDDSHSYLFMIAI
ncbi:hypothetical protein JR338_09345 [Chloroflexota bacterium]|nr:hypothetical protein JR338_09345 [Chloroflexota bacterium]